MRRLLAILSTVAFLSTSSLALTPLQADEPPRQEVRAADEAAQLLGVHELFETLRHQVVSVQTEMAPPTGALGELFQGPDGEPVRGEGSGFVVDEEGLVVTNWHVVAGAQSIQITTADGQSHPARLIGADPSTDIALLEVDTDEPMEVARLGSTEDLDPGTWVIAVGSPFGLEQSVTVGVISAKGRQIGLGPYDDFLQTDASINPGNSGGPLYNLDGEVVGVNTAIIPFGGGIGFAVPVDTVQDILPQLRDDGHVVRGYIGAGIQDMSPDLAETFGLDPRDGVLLRSIEPDGPADEAGLAEGDVITHINTERTRNSVELLSSVARLQPGDSVRVDLLRDGERRHTEIEVGERPDPARQEVEQTLQPEPIEPGRLGVVLRSVTRDMAERYDLPRGVGVYVDRIEAGSPASGVLRQGDIVLSIGETQVRAPADVPPLLREQPRDEPIRILIHRDGEPHYVAVRLLTESE